MYSWVLRGKRKATRTVPAKEERRNRYLIFIKKLEKFGVAMRNKKMEAPPTAAAATRPPVDTI